MENSPNVQSSYSPEVLTLFLTYRCTVECEHCSFSCSPREEECLSPDVAMSLIEEAAFARRLTISGGEPFTEMEALERIIAFSGSLSRFEEISVITNGSWASSPWAAAEIMGRFKNYGLSTLALSVDPFHQKSVPLKVAVNAAKAAIRAGLRLTVNTTSTHEQFESGDLPEETVFLAHELGEEELAPVLVREYVHAFRGKRTGIPFIQGEVLPAGRARDAGLLSFGAYDLSREWQGMCVLQKKSKAPFREGQTLTIMPNYDVLPCCTLYAREGHMVIGNAKSGNLREIITRAAQDPVIRSLASHGIAQIHALAEGLEEAYLGRKFPSPCEFCFEIMNDRRTLKKILEVMET